MNRAPLHPGMDKQPAFASLTGASVLTALALALCLLGPTLAACPGWCNTDADCMEDEVCAFDRRCVLPGTVGPFGPSTPSSSSGWSSSSSSSGGWDSSTTNTSGAWTHMEVTSSWEPLVNAFPTLDGFLVVEAQAVKLVERSGYVRKWMWLPRPVVTAAFDGSLLAVVDTAMLILFDAHLENRREHSLGAPCQQAVLVNDGRLVCGSMEGADRRFRVYRTSDGLSLSESNVFSTEGIPMRLVPGANAFVTINAVSPPDSYHLFSVSEDQTVQKLASKDEPDGVTASPVMAFWGNPATHLITHHGHLVRILGEGCTSGCFRVEAILHEVGTGIRFLAMDSDERGTLYGLQSTSFTMEDGCSWGCYLKRVDLRSRTEESSTYHYFDASELIVGRYDAVSNAFLVGFKPSYPTDATGPHGYTLMLLAL